MVVVGVGVMMMMMMISAELSKLLGQYQDFSQRQPLLLQIETA
jgi:hypothetical protein